MGEILQPFFQFPEIFIFYLYQVSGPLHINHRFQIRPPQTQLRPPTLVTGIRSQATRTPDLKQNRDGVHGPHLQISVLLPSALIHFQLRHKYFFVQFELHKVRLQIFLFGILKLFQLVLYMLYMVSINYLLPNGILYMDMMMSYYNFPTIYS